MGPDDARATAEPTWLNCGLIIAQAFSTSGTAGNMNDGRSWRLDLRVNVAC